MSDVAGVPPMIDGIQSALAPHGPEAARILEITWIMVIGGAAIFALVMTLAALAVLAPRPWLSGTRLIVAGGIVLPVVVLPALLVYTLLAEPRLSAAGNADLAIRVVAYQWWWRVDYLDARGRIDFTTANEIHIPVGQVVELRLQSADVLHSFWVPALAGKLDHIPGKDNRLRLMADRPGTYRGQCAEYCGGPHAQMAFFLVAEAPARFESWRAAQRRPRAGAPDGEAARGERLFLAHCVVCHTVRGTIAEGELGPDLTHFASRLSLGAGILPNRAGTVAGWITSSQHLKPGNLMPEFRQFDSAELRALTRWLESLE